MPNELTLNENELKEKIFFVRDTQVMLDRDLAELYNVTTKALNQAVKRNVQRFPYDFVFKLSENEKNELVTSCDRLKSMKYSSQLPYAFTEHGILILSGILRSSLAARINVTIIRAFIAMRKFISRNAEIFSKLDHLERKQLEYQVKSEEKFDHILKLIESKEIKPSKGIFFDGQVFDAYAFVLSVVRSAKKSIVLIDNYVDESVLTLFSECKGVKVLIYTQNLTKKLELDVQKFNSQHGGLEIRKFIKSHDRFMIIDEEVVYHFGASLKDLGKKWFAFSTFKKETLDILHKLP